MQRNYLKKQRNNGMKNLVIHLKDSTTTFLNIVYEKLADVTVIDGNTSPIELKEAIKKSDRVMMMGHGSPLGLFSINCFLDSFRPYVICEDEVGLLRGKDQNIYIWCHANKFVEVNDLRGFYSGMFISEVLEACFCGLQGVTQDMVTESNMAFVRAVGENISLPKEELYENVIKEYGKIAENNPVSVYNIERLSVR